MSPRWSLESLWTNSLVGIAQIDREGHIVSANPKWQALHGYAPGENPPNLHSREVWYEPLEGHDALLLDAEIFAGLREGYELTSRFRTKSGRYFWGKIFVSAAYNAMGRIQGVTHLVIDVTREHQLMAAMEQLASADPLCRIWNRRFFFQLTSKEIARARRTSRPLSLIYLDIDYFKRINDTFGHQAGDRVLQHLSRTCETLVRTSDILGRIGGEEFAITCPSADPNGVHRLAERIRSRIKASTLHIAGRTILYTVSIGLATLQETDDLESLLKRADRALYTAKDSGRNRVAAG